MKLSSILILYTVGIVLFFSSCSKGLRELNIDRKDASSADGGTFFTYAMKSMADLMSTTSYGTESQDQSIRNVWRLYTQYYTQVQGGLDDSKYFLTQSPGPQNVWKILYTDILSNLKESGEIIKNGTNVDEEVRINKLAIIEIMQVYAFSTLVEIFGDVPYFEALDVNNVLPKYDKQDEIYADLVKRLDNALSSIVPGKGSLGSADPFYSGNINKWLKYGNSLKLRLGLRIADVSPDISRGIVIEAIQSGVMDSNEDNMVFAYLTSPPNTNLLWRALVESGQHYFIPAQALVDSMNRFNDPRRDVYFTRFQNGFVGGQYGLSISYSSVSHVGDYFMKPDLPQVLFDYSSVEFFLAEAAEREFWGTQEDAKEHYNKAIEASLLYFGTSADEITNYLSQGLVNYSTAAGDWKQKIGVQKWIAEYNQGVEPWTEYRRLDFPILIPPIDGFVNQVPVRFTYPINEQTLNNNNYNNAAASVGGDLLTTKLFWDKF